MFSNDDAISAIFLVKMEQVFAVMFTHRVKMLTIFFQIIGAMLLMGSY